MTHFHPRIYSGKVLRLVILSGILSASCNGFSTDDLSSGQFLPDVAIKSVTPISPNSIQVAFNQDMQVDGVSRQKNYSIAAADGSSLQIRAMAVVQGSQNRLVSLATDLQEAGTLYKITVKHVFSTQGRSTAADGADYNFAGYSVSQDGAHIQLAYNESTLASGGLFDFGLQNTNEAGEKKDVVLSNTGNSELIISQITFQSDDNAVVLDNPGPGNLAAGESLTLSFQAEPPAAGSYSGVLHVYSNDSDKPDFSLNILVTGFDLGSPVPGGSITTADVEKESLNLLWPAADDNTSSQAVLEYQAYYSGSNVLKTVAAAEELGTPAGSYEAANLSVSISGLTKNTVYYFAVIVRDTAGNKSIYPYISQKTAGDAEMAVQVTPDQADPEFNHFYVFNNTLFFRANTDTCGSEIYSYHPNDGLQFFDIKTGSAGSFPQTFIEWNSILYFYADGGDGNGGELWSYDGISAPAFEYDITPGGGAAGSSAINTMAVFQGNLFIDAKYDSSVNHFVVKYDGATAAPVSATVMHVGGKQTPLFASGGYLLFFGFDGITAEVYEYDGTNSPTTVTIPSYPYYMYPVEFNGKMHFLSTNSGSGSAGNLTEYTPGSGTAVDISTTVTRPEYLTVYNSKLYFSAFGSGDEELYSYDGSTVSLVANIHTTGSSAPMHLTVSGGILYFSADDGIHGRELWRYDGTNPPELVMDINEGTDSNPDNLTDLDGVLYFNADDGVNGNELWRVKF